MSETKHTTEPWGFYQTEKTGLPPDPCPCLVIDTLGREIPSTNPVVCIISDISSLNNRDWANARRIVACVNACAGISTEKLEENAADPIAGIFGRMAAREGQRADKAESQRDELLAALKECKLYFGEMPRSVSGRIYRKIQSVIDRVENHA